MLLDHGANINARDSADMSFFRLAVETGCLNIVDMLLSKSNVNKMVRSLVTDEYTLALDIAVDHGNEPLIQRLRAWGSGHNITDEPSISLLEPMHRENLVVSRVAHKSLDKSVFVQMGWGEDCGKEYEKEKPDGASFSHPE
jgi:ankyrin repeat protein